MNNLMALVATEAERAAQTVGDDPIAKLRAAMKVSYRHWMVTDEDVQFRGALEGAARCMNEEEVERLAAELRLLNAFSAASTGVPVNFDQVIPENTDEVPKPFGVLGLWGDVKEEADVRR